MRILLRPFAWLYGLALRIRHRLYDLGVWNSARGPVPTVVVGNLELGGTGKSPVTDFILSLLSQEFSLGLLSRGYGRQSTGYRPISAKSSANEVGDEPLMLSMEHPKVHAAVCEDRLEGLQALSDNHQLDLIILDDAMQHRNLLSDFNVLVTSYRKPFWENRLLPEGTLRDLKSRARHAHTLIVTNCPPDMSLEARSAMRAKAQWHLTCPVYFSSVTYERPVHLTTGRELGPEVQQIIAFSGIANDDAFKTQVAEWGQICQAKTFADHHVYTGQDIKKLKQIYANFDAASTVLVTTAKDAVKLRSKELESEVSKLPIYVLKMKIDFLDKGFEEILSAYARTNKRNSSLDI